MEERGPLSVAQDWLVAQEERLYRYEAYPLAFARGQIIDLILPVSATNDDHNWGINYFRWSLTQEQISDLLKRWKAHQQLQIEWTNVHGINWSDIDHEAVPYEHEPWQYFQNRLHRHWTPGIAEHVSKNLHSTHEGFCWVFWYDRSDHPIDWESEVISAEYLEKLQTVAIPPEGLFLEQLTE